MIAEIATSPLYITTFGIGIGDPDSRFQAPHLDLRPKALGQSASVTSDRHGHDSNIVNTALQRSKSIMIHLQ